MQNTCIAKAISRMPSHLPATHPHTHNICASIGWLIFGRLGHRPATTDGDPSRNLSPVNPISVLLSVRDCSGAMHCGSTNPLATTPRCPLAFKEWTLSHLLTNTSCVCARCGRPKTPRYGDLLRVLGTAAGIDHVPTRGERMWGGGG